MSEYIEQLKKIDEDRDPLFGIPTELEMMIAINKKMEELEARIKVLEGATKEA